jgi:predicted lipoprotein with Yx(FWY)xxD motif
MRPLAIAVVMALAVAACNGGTDDETTTTDATGSPSTSQAAPDDVTTTEPAPGSTAGPGTTAPQGDGGEIGTGETSLGGVLVDDAGLTLYIFGVDPPGESTCYDSCQSTWPPVPASLTAGAGVDVELGSHTRTDGMEQLTVNGHPVYLYAGDSSPGDVNGQGVGDVWFAVGTDGEPITE